MVEYSELGITSVDSFISDVLEPTLGYLEKASGSNLGDFTAAGKIVNAGYNNYTVYWDWYKTLTGVNYQKEAYCACYVSTQLCRAFGYETAKKMLHGSLYIGCQDGYDTFKSNNAIATTPRVGDAVVFWSDSLNRYGHTGLVVGVDDSGFTTIEANTSSGNNTVVRNGGATCRKHYTFGARKCAFLRIAYEDYGIALHGESNSNAITTYAIGTGATGLTVTADSLNVRNNPGTDGTSVVGSIAKGTSIYPTEKAFINGDAWFHIDTGWVSSKYMTGWIQEKTADNKWWFLLEGYNYYTNRIVEIGDASYYFDDSGYMFTGTIEFTTDENGALKRS